MLLSQDMRDLLEIFEEHDVKYVLVGVYPVSFRGVVRATQGIDLLVYPSIPNAKRVMVTLEELGFGDARGG